MKKIMIALSAVALTVCANAATTNWKLHQGNSGVLYDGYKRVDGGTYSKAALQATVYAIAVDTITQEKLVDAFRGDKFDITTYSLGNKSTSSVGKMTQANGVSFSRTNVDVGASKSYYEAVIVTYSGKDYLYVSDGVAVTALDNEAVAAFTINPTSSSQQYYGTEEYGSAGWYAKGSGAAPEPTSGLLLLVGIAGLALRRRRA